LKKRTLHIIIYFLLTWSFFSVFNNFLKWSERIAKQKLSYFIICFSVAISFAQQYTNYSTKDGLPSNHVYSILQDTKGFIWFLTDKGMVKYNGKTFKTFTTKNGLSNNDIWEAFPTSDGKFWYMSKSASLGYIENDSVISFPNANKDEIMNPLFTSQVGDSIYPTESKKTYTLRNNKWVGEINKHSENLLTDWVKIRHKNIDYMSFSFKGEILRIYAKKTELLHSIQIKNIYGKSGLRGQINDSLFCWTNSKNYSIFNFNSFELKQFNLKESLGYDLITHPKIKSINNVLQISGDGFVARLDEDLEIQSPFYFPEELKATFGIIDKSNNIWLSTINKGVYKLPYSKRNVKYSLQNEKIQTFSTINNSLVVGVFNKGIYKYNRKDNSFQQSIENKDFVFGVSEIEPLKTNFYAFRNSLLKEVNGKIKRIYISNFYKQETYSNDVARKLVYFNDKLYGNFSYGINKINPEPFTLEKQYNQKGCNEIINFNNRLLIATTNGLKEIKKDKLIPVVFNNADFKKSILSFTVIDENHLLINTDGFGSYITNMQTIKQLKKTEFLIVEEAFVEDATLWLATNTGVLKFKKDNETYNLSKTYTINDGLPTNHINTLYVDNKNLIVGTDNGIAILPKKQEYVSQFIDVLIERANFNNENITEDKTTFNYQENNNLNFLVSSIDFYEGKPNISFKYKLEPLQKEWITSTTNIVNFNNLHPENYVFHLKSGLVQKQLSFIIKPLWWQTNWAKTLAFLSIFGLISLVSWKLSKKRQEKKNIKLFQEKKLTEIQLKALRSQMNPHFVFNSLAAIQYYINNNEIKASEAYLVKFSKLIRQFFELSKETEISLSEEIKLIKNYLDIEKLRFKDKFEYAFTIDNKIDVKQMKLPTMLLQPIVENAINHGVFNKIDNGNVIINMNYLSRKRFKVEIIDDGVGFVNTQNKSNKKIKSSNVLEDRLRFLNQSGQWDIQHSEEELHPELYDKGNRSTFIITQL
jgi:ligand-binding sensor domain-containing protein